MKGIRVRGFEGLPLKGKVQIPEYRQRGLQCVRQVGLAGVYEVQGEHSHNFLGVVRPPGANRAEVLVFYARDLPMPRPFLGLVLLEEGRKERWFCVRICCAALGSTPKAEKSQRSSDWGTSDHPMDAPMRMVAARFLTCVCIAANRAWYEKVVDSSEIVS